MSASLVGSEMCIRDRPPRALSWLGVSAPLPPLVRNDAPVGRLWDDYWICLLYTSDAADDM
eukprot:486670-Alexandrium_andersonii.AAC.1